MPATLEGFKSYLAKSGMGRIPPDRVLLAAIGRAKCGGKGGKPGPCPEGGQDEPAADIPKPKADHPQIHTPEFKAWFGDSKVVDAAGKPLVVYHGTNSDFSEFKTTGIGEFGPGIYLSSSPDDAGSYALQRGKTEGARTLPTFVKMSNPFVIRADEDPGKFFSAFPTAKTDEETIAQAKAAGFDGIVYHRPTGSKQGAGSGATHYIAFDPTQIKSATANKGKFDLKDPNITKTWLDRAVRRAWGRAKGGPGSGIRGHKTDRPERIMDPAKAPQETVALPGGTKPIAAPANQDKFKEILADRKKQWAALDFEFDAPMDQPPPGYDRESGVHVPTLVSETQKRTHEKLRLHKLATDVTVMPKERTRARVELARQGGLNADEQKIADLCKSLLGVDAGTVAKLLVETAVAKCGGKGGKPGPCAGVVFHATNKQSAKDLETTGIDDDALNKRDSGFFGAGFYTSAVPQDLYGKSIVAVHLKPDAKVLEVGELNPKEPQPWHKEFAASIERRILKHRPDYPPDKMAANIAAVTPGSPTFSHIEYAQEVGRFARSEGFDAVAFAEGQETVILNKAAVESIKHVGGLKSAEKYHQKHKDTVLVAKTMAAALSIGA